MKRRLIKTVFILLVVILPGYSGSMYDVVVYGGSAGGFTAAIQAAKMGKKVALIEPSGHIGGIMIEGLGITDIDAQKAFQNSVAVGGLALEFYRRAAVYYRRDKAFDEAIRNRIKNHSLWPVECHVAEKIVLDWLAEYPGIDLYLYDRLPEVETAVTRRGGRITDISLENTKTGKAQKLRGRMFVDATIEGDLLAASGVTTVVGREPNSLYNETLNGIREITDHAQFNVKVNPYVNPDDPNSGLIATIQDEPLGTPGAGDKRLQAYCMRMCLTRDTANMIPITRPGKYDRSQYEIYLRFLRAGGKLLRPWISVPNGKTDMGAWHDLSHNLYGMNFGYADGNYATRRRIYEQHRDFTHGLFYFLANDPEVAKLDSNLQKDWAPWGLAKDEFVDNGGWPRQFYVRDARRMVSDYVITQHHILLPDPTPVPDPVGVAFWPPDVHSVRRIVKDGYAYNEGFVFEPFGRWRPLPVSYRALVPKSEECTNLITPTCPSSSHIAYGAIRLEWTFMVLGQSVATAAVMALEEGTRIQDVNYEKLKARLLRDQQVLSLSVVPKETIDEMR